MATLCQLQVMASSRLADPAGQQPSKSASVPPSLKTSSIAVSSDCVAFGCTCAVFLIGCLHMRGNVIHYLLQAAT